MLRIETHRELQKARQQSFRYVCKRDFLPMVVRSYDHVPAEAIFLPADRHPLKLPTHLMCNLGHHLTDEKLGQLIALRRAGTPIFKHRRLHALSTNLGTALINLNLDEAVWRWITGFHAALYRHPLHFKETEEPQKPFIRSLVLPFPKGSRGSKQIEPLHTQHLAFVKMSNGAE